MLMTTNTNEDNTLANNGLKLRYTTNHDVTSSDGSPVTIYNGKQGSLAAFVLAAYVTGVPLLYNGQEVGSPKKINIFNDDPIDWTTNPDMVAEYKRIITFRSNHEAIKTGVLTVYNNSDVIAFEKKSGTEDVLILVNARNNDINYSVPAALQNTAWINGFNDENITLSQQLHLSAYGYLILSKKIN